MLNLREWNNCEHPDDWKGLWGTLWRVMFLVYVYCLERNAKTAKSLLLPGRLPEIGAVFFWPSSHVIYPWESYFPLCTPPLGAVITASCWGCAVLFTSLSIFTRTITSTRCTGPAEAVNKYKSNMEFLPWLFSEILAYCDLFKTFCGCVTCLAAGTTAQHPASPSLSRAEGVSGTDYLALWKINAFTYPPIAGAAVFIRGERSTGMGREPWPAGDGSSRPSRGPELIERRGVSSVLSRQWATPQNHQT